MENDSTHDAQGVQGVDVVVLPPPCFFASGTTTPNDDGEVSELGDVDVDEDILALEDVETDKDIPPLEAVEIDEDIPGLEEVDTYEDMPALEEVESEENVSAKETENNRDVPALEDIQNDEDGANLENGGYPHLEEGTDIPSAEFVHHGIMHQHLLLWTRPDFPVSFQQCCQRMLMLGQIVNDLGSNKGWDKTNVGNPVLICMLPLYMQASL
jgi:hypothetical protein